mgnify:CR=1 FL=1
MEEWGDRSEDRAWNRLYEGRRGGNTCKCGGTEIVDFKKYLCTACLEKEQEEEKRQAAAGYRPQCRECGQTFEWPDNSNPWGFKFCEGHK